jgi:hypothetical protein
MRYSIKFKNGEANICLEATLPLPEAPIEFAEVHGGKRQRPALFRIEALLSEFLSEQIFLRIQEPDDMLTGLRECSQIMNQHTLAQP